MKVNIVDCYSYRHAIALGCVQNWFYHHNDLKRLQRFKEQYAAI